MYPNSKEIIKAVTSDQSKSSPPKESTSCALKRPRATVESGSVKIPVLHNGLFQAKPLSTDTNSVYLFLLNQSGSIDKIFAIVDNNQKCSDACHSPEDHISQGFCPSVTSH